MLRRRQHPCRVGARASLLALLGITALAALRATSRRRGGDGAQLRAPVAFRSARIPTSRAASPRSGRFSAGAVATAPAQMTTDFPFCRIVGQEDMKLAALLNAVDPAIGGVLVFGDRGTGKSTCIQSMKGVLPLIEVVKDDEYNSHPTDSTLQGPEAKLMSAKGERIATTKITTPIIQLPLGATEDKVCGTINMEEALLSGEKKFEPGLLAKANRGILFVDEINLMEDSLVDVVLDSAAGGYNKVEREGISAEHPAKYILIATGHPDEGEMRPQLLDRFGLFVTADTITNSTECTQMILDRMEYEEDAEEFCKKVEAEQKEIRDRIERARQLLPQVDVTEEHMLTVADICGRLGTEGIRGDLACIRAAKASAALDGRTEVSFDDLRQVVPLALGHRLKKDPTDPLFDSNRKSIVRKVLENVRKLREME